MPNRSVKAAGKLFPAVASTPAVQSLVQRLESGGALSCSQVSVSAQPFFATLLRYLFPQRPIVLVTSGLKVQETFHQDVQTWLEQYSVSSVQSVGNSEDRTLNTENWFYPAWEIFPHEPKLPHVDVISERLQTLVSLKRGSQSDVAPIVVTSVSALLQKTFRAGEIEQRTRSLQRGDQTEPLDLIEWLEEQGYEPEAQVTQKGEISLRGGILDLWPLTSAWPVRLEFFGNELESLRFFDPFSQISREEIQAVTIPPGGELGLLKRAVQANKFELATLLDYLPRETIFLLCEPELLDEQAKRYAEQVAEDDPFFISWSAFQDQVTAKEMAQIEVTESGDIPLLEDVEDFRGDAGRTMDEISFRSLEIYRPIGDRPPEPQIAEVQRREFFGQLHRWLRQDYSVHVFCNNEGEKQRFEEVWMEYGLGKERPLTQLGAISRGFLFEAAKTVVVTDAEIFGRYKVQRPRRLKSSRAQTSKSLLDIDFTELEHGDYVVHLQHGIGRYQGLQVLPAAHGRKQADGSLRPEKEGDTARGQECLVIEYGSSDPEQPAPRLYVPVSEAHLVSKYVGAGKARPQLNTIGGTRWAKAKQQAEVAVRDLASELLRIQAVREAQTGHSFPTDSPWQREFESSFLYEETPDQMRAIIESKNDMEGQRPMDRLICGDVGYGKTEVAIRAAFKAVMGGKQVAILVPTTVLAQQHYNTFRERMSDYPVKIDLLSRFRTRREGNQVIENLAAGSVDIVIGTHRLLQKDIQFKDLGLVVIDEEQRFGVMHKERFKMLRQMVDVLTLSATPIPRTLYLALTGARDMSTIETPPQDRLPVETIVTQFDERVIRDAIRREMNREGQVFFLHNRVTTIEAMAMRLKTLVPEARILVGHGQMDPDDLEKVMTQFVNGEADVLLATTIIESGLDIPNANTIIIDRADRFGLSELYQLRGRVGRYKHQAYAYLMLPRHAGLLVDARKRISAIKQYSSLGSGFKIAMRDLEIRGAGNILGPQQSGHITAVGFDLYCQLLKQSVSRLKGEKVKPRVEVLVRLDFISLNAGEQKVQHAKAETQSRTEKKPLFEINVPRETAVYYSEESSSSDARAVQPDIKKGSAYIPFDYITESRHRVEMYRKIAQATDKPALDSLKKELRDRFGPVPPAMELLLQINDLKVLASEKNVTAIESKDDKLMLTRNNNLIQLGGKFPRLTKRDAKARLMEIKKLLLSL
ncbi:MAG: transcription-repair coupling factor [Verrucomicrobia bacterium]|nr:transcription-repair coupling factor [Verrucomicrobiota bacterium]